MESPSLRQLLLKAARVAPQETSVLITGETGVGKERLARWLHGHSGRAAAGFFAVNCAAFPDTLLDTHLFGHARGAFTGAVKESAGVFEAAAGGTLFLDEIGEVSSAMQVKLLRVLQEREVRRVGEWRLRHIDVRLIAATNRDLREEVAQGRFRADLLYRLRGVELHIPPLRERRDDVEAIGRELLEQVAARLGRAITGFAGQALACLVRYDWPGNIRELENAIDEACAMASGTEIEVEDLPETVRQGWAPGTAGPGAPTGPTGARAVVTGLNGPSGPAVPSACRTGARRPLDELERAYIEAVLRREGSVRRAADALGLSLSALKRKLLRLRGSMGAFQKS